jgi:crotonobetainyl-CoA:carnitine CoA-transferase CaiB-like acyl-CoA transferase
VQATLIVVGGDPGFRPSAGQLLTDLGFSVVRVAGIADQAIAVAWFLPEAHLAGALLRNDVTR